MRYWITHPNLTPAHDHEIEALALADWQRSGWRIRKDQTPPPIDTTPADPRERDSGPTPTPRTTSSRRTHIDTTKGEV